MLTSWPWSVRTDQTEPVVHRRAEVGAARPPSRRGAVRRRAVRKYVYRRCRGHGRQQLGGSVIDAGTHADTSVRRFARRRSLRATDGPASGVGGAKLVRPVVGACCDAVGVAVKVDGGAAVAASGSDADHRTDRGGGGEADAAKPARPRHSVGRRPRWRRCVQAGAGGGTG